MSPPFEHSPLFDDVRDAHRSERAPAGLRKSSLERFEAGLSGVRERSHWRDALKFAWTRHRLSAAAAAGALLLWLLAQASGTGWRPSGDDTALAPENPAELPASADGASRAASAPPPPDLGAPGQPCPRQGSGMMPIEPWSAQDAPFLEGMTEHSLRLPLDDCDDLIRYYLERLPDAPAARALSPVMILLHDSGSRPLEARVQTRWYFEALARQRGFVLIYASAKGSPRMLDDPPLVDGLGGRREGVWQTDPGADRRVDDALYLQRVMDDLTSRGVIAGGNPVWLAGFGGGAALALTLAAQHPDRYDGVAAFELRRFDIAAPARTPGSRLERVLFASKGKPVEVWGDARLQGLAQRWAQALGVRETAAAQPRTRFSMQGKLGRFDLGNDASQGSSVRVLAIDPGLDPFPPPGAIEPALLADLRRRPGFFNGAEEAWRYLKSAPTKR